MLTTGGRQSLGLYVAPLQHDFHLSLSQVSLALAIGQFTWGAVQPLFGFAADLWGPTRVLVTGGLLMAIGFSLTPFVHGTAGLILSLGLLSAAGAGAGSFSILIGATAGRIPVEKRGLASGIINAGASLGQFLFAPLNLFLIGTVSWVGGMFTMAALMLASIPLSLALRQPASAVSHHADESGTQQRGGLGAALREAFGDRSYWCLHAGFFTCGFHVAFLVTHLPTEVSVCGLPGSVAATSLAVIGLSNIVGSLSVGALAHRYRMKFLLFGVYFLRVLAIAAYLLAPHTATTFYVFSVVLGVSWLSTVPPTAGLVGKLFGTRYLATLFGMTLLSHQTGAFFGAWAGGWAMEHFGSFQGMWITDMALALCAALINLPIREAPYKTVIVRPA
jgi:MFS family permease